MNDAVSDEKGFLVIGANHRSSSLTLRDRLFVDASELPSFGLSVQKEGLDQFIILSTCDRVEIHVASDDFQESENKLIKILAERAQLTPEEIKNELYIVTKGDAVRHIFRVASSLDSLMVGEPQIIGQVKDAHKFAVGEGYCGPALDQLYQAAYAGAKKIRTETSISERPVSIASVAVQTAKDLHGDLSRCKGLLIGAGDMGELTAESLIEAGLKNFTCIHSFEGRAKSIARQLGCRVGDFEARNQLACEADIIVTSMNKRQKVVVPEMVVKALKVRKRKPIFLIDTGIPGDVDAAVHDIDGAFLYDLHDLEKIALEGRASREAEAHHASDLLDHEIQHFLQGQKQRDASPILTEVKDHFEEVRKQALAQYPDDAERATHLMINRLLHGPMEEMKRKAMMQEATADDKKDWEETQKLLSQLFLTENNKK